MNKINSELQAKSQNKKSVSQTIAEEIATMIGRRILHPGEHLVENTLAHKFNASRSSVREALTILERDHLVERIPYQGVKVRNFTSKEIYDLYDAIYGLEWLAMEKAMSNVTDDHIKELNNILEEQYKAIKAEEVERYYELNEEFHYYILSITDNIFLVKLYKYLQRMVRPFRLLSLAQGNNMQLSYEEHSLQKDALKNKNINVGNSAIKGQKDRALKSLKILFPEDN